MQKASMEPRIGRREEAPQFVKDFYNPFILTGYRINFDSHTSVWGSIFMKHNETCNIWTHLLGALAFLFMLLNLHLVIPTVEIAATHSSVRLSEVMMRVDTDLSELASQDWV